MPVGDSEKIAVTITIRIEPGFSDWMILGEDHSW